MCAMDEATVLTVTGTKVHLLGHWLYVRKCKRPDVVDATGRVLIEMPNLAKNFADHLFSWVTLIGKGPKVGKLATGEYGKLRFRRGYAKHIPDEMKLGDMLLIPIQPWRFMHSPYWPEDGIEFFVDETVPLCIYRKEDAT